MTLILDKSHHELNLSCLYESVRCSSSEDRVSALREIFVFPPQMQPCCSAPTVEFVSQEAELSLFYISHNNRLGRKQQTERERERGERERVIVRDRKDEREGGGEREWYTLEMFNSIFPSLYWFQYLNLAFEPRTSKYLHLHFTYHIWMLCYVYA